MKKTLATVLAVGTLLLTAGCSEAFTFEAEPTDGAGSYDEDTGYDGDPRDITCFTIEADSDLGDDGDRQLGTFCKTGGSEADRNDDQEDDD